MVSALAAAGWIGLTAIGDTLEQARALYAHVNAALDEAVQVSSDAPERAFIHATIARCYV
jgi:hypothetical protein